MYQSRRKKEVSQITLVHFMRTTINQLEDKIEMKVNQEDDQLREEIKIV